MNIKLDLFKIIILVFLFNTFPVPNLKNVINKLFLDYNYLN